jgi:hypothetical protein
MTPKEKKRKEKKRSCLNKFSWKWMYQEINPHLLGDYLLYFDQILDD